MIHGMFYKHMKLAVFEKITNIDLIIRIMCVFAIKSVVQPPAIISPYSSCPLDL
jgi:hypothetical protein